MCAAAFWFDACQEMHFPTSFRDRGIAPHRDPTPPVDTSLLAALLGAPEARITGPDEVSIAIDEDGTRGSVEVLVQNIGTWIAPYRIQTSAPWILVERINRSGRLHGGVAVGAETTVVICTARFCGEDVTKRGHVVALRITLDPEELPEGEDVRGVVVIEPLFGRGEGQDRRGPCRPQCGDDRGVGVGVGVGRRGRGRGRPRPAAQAPHRRAEPGEGRLATPARSSVG